MRTTACCDLRWTQENGLQSLQGAGVGGGQVSHSLVSSSLLRLHTTTTTHHLRTTTATFACQTGQEFLMRQ